MNQVIGTVYHHKGMEGDFDWQIRSRRYEDCLFLYNDDEKRRHWKKAGTGNAVIRKYNRHALSVRPRSVGICTGDGEGGYEKLTDHVKTVIVECISDARKMIEKYNYKKVYYSARTPNGLLGTSIFIVGDDVIEYITQEIKKLEDIK